MAEEYLTKQPDKLSCQNNKYYGTEGVSSNPWFQQKEEPIASGTTKAWEVSGTYPGRISIGYGIRYRYASCWKYRFLLGHSPHKSWHLACLLLAICIVLPTQCCNSRFPVPPAKVGVPPSEALICCYSFWSSISWGQEDHAVLQEDARGTHNHQTLALAGTCGAEARSLDHLLVSWPCTLNFELLGSGDRWAPCRLMW